MNSIWLMLGIKPEGFRAGLKTARDESKQFEKDWKDIGKIFAGGGITMAVVSFFTTMIAHARDAKNSIDENFLAVRRFGSSFDEAKTKIEDLGTGLLGMLNRAGEAWGGIINIITHGVAASDISDAAAKGAEDAERSLARAKEHEAEFKSITEGIKNTLKSVKDTRLGELTLQEQLNRRENEYYDLVIQRANYQGIALGRRQLDLKVAQALLEVEQAEAALIKQKTADDVAWFNQRKGYEKSLKEAAFEKLTPEKQILSVEKEVNKWRSSQAKYEKDSNEYLALQVKINEGNASIEKIRAEQGEKIAASAAEAKKNMEGQAAAAALTQKAFEAITFGITNGGYNSQQIQDANDAALKEAKRRNSNQLVTLQDNPGSAFNYGNSLTILRLQNENTRIQRELDTRSSLQKSVSLLGVEGARRAYAGDPLLFDKLVAQFVQSQTATDKTNELLTRINQQLDPGANGNHALTAPVLVDTVSKGFEKVTQQLRANGNK